MKKWIVIIGILIVALNHGKVKTFFNSPQDYSKLNDSDVVLYATEWCGYCEKTREFFSENKIPYYEYDIDKSEDGRRQYESIGLRGVPVVVAKGTVIHGYDRAAILKALD